jgi:hypothetical protein
VRPCARVGASAHTQCGGIRGCLCVRQVLPPCTTYAVTTSDLLTSLVLNVVQQKQRHPTAMHPAPPYGRRSAPLQPSQGLVAAPLKAAPQRRAIAMPAGCASHVLCDRCQRVMFHLGLCHAQFSLEQITTNDLFVRGKRLIYFHISSSTCMRVMAA